MNPNYYDPTSWQISNPGKYNIGQQARVSFDVLRKAGFSEVELSHVRNCMDLHGFVVVKAIKEQNHGTKREADIGVIIPFESLVF